jgi:23S rRNA (uracil1939-C5)-methyltransferase
MNARLKKPDMKRGSLPLPSRQRNNFIATRTLKNGPRLAPRLLTCELQAKCQACAYVNDKYQAGLTHKYQAGLDVLREAKLIGSTKLLDPVPSPKTLHYRASAKLAVSPSFSSERQLGKRFRIGLYKPNSHDVIEVASCPLHVPTIKQVLVALQEELEASPLSPWNERTCSGDVRYIAMRASHLTAEVMLTFVVANLACRNEIKKIVNKLSLRHQRVTSTYLNLHSESGNGIFGAETIHLSGQKYLRESLCGLRFEISPTSFFQINPWQAQNLFRRIEQLVGNSQNAIAWDLYCGSGPIAMVLARAGFRVLAIDENPSCIKDAGINVHRNKLSSAITFVTSATESALTEIPAWGQNPQVIVTNPSRKGLAPAAREEIARVLARSPSTQLIYVSCEVKTLARDLVALQSSGFALRQLEAFDMFAQTEKMEWLAVLTKGQSCVP